jgi:hypothetical protein
MTIPAHVWELLESQEHVSLGEATNILNVMPQNGYS